MLAVRGSITGAFNFVNSANADRLRWNPSNAPGITLCAEYIATMFGAAPNDFIPIRMLRV